MLKMVMIVYNEAIDQEVSELLKIAPKILNYTKVRSAFGKGATSGTHEGTDVWPGQNNILYVNCSDHEAKKLMSSVRELRKSLGKEGIKAFLLPVEDVT